MSVSGGATSLSTITGTSSSLACKDGEIQLILGPMFSGKTSELMRRVRRYKLYKKCLVISYKVIAEPQDETKHHPNIFSRVHLKPSTNSPLDEGPS